MGNKIMNKKNCNVCKMRTADTILLHTFACVRFNNNDYYAISITIFKRNVVGDTTAQNICTNREENAMHSYPFTKLKVQYAHKHTYTVIATRLRTC